MVRPQITLYVDLVSPFAYIAYFVLRNDPIFRDCDVSYVPIFLGGLMQKTGNIPPIRIANKSTWIEDERLCWARRFSVPIKEEQMAGFPPNTLGAGRALAVLAHLDGDRGRQQVNLVRALDALYHDLWVCHEPIFQPEGLREVLERVLGPEMAEKVTTMAGVEGKELLRQNTDKAFAAGAFGLPWMTCVDANGQTRGFWGVDHFGVLAEFLGLKKPGNGGWAALL